MRRLLAIAIVLIVSGCSAPRFNRIKFWAGIRIPMPGSPVEVAIDLDLQDSTAHQEKMRSMDLYADVWKRMSEEKPNVQE